MALLLNHDGFGRNWTIVLRDFAKSLRKLKIFSFKKSVFFIVESIISFISFSKGPWKLNKTIFYDLQPKNLIYFDLIETKLTSEMEEGKPFIFAGFSLLTRSCLVCFHMMTFPWQKGVGKNTSRWSNVTKSAAPKAINEEKSPRKLHTIPYNKIIRNCMELSGILTVQALCVSSWCHPFSW